MFAVCVFPPLYVVLIWFTQSNLGNGAIGASLANLLGESSLLVWGWIVLPKRLRQPEVVRPGLQILALCGAMVLLVVGLRWAGLSILLYVPVGALFYLVGAWMLKLVTPQDIDLIKETLRRRTRRPAPATLTPATSLEPPTL